MGRINPSLTSEDLDNTFKMSDTYNATQNNANLTAPGPQGNGPLEKDYGNGEFHSSCAPLSFHM